MSTIAVFSNPARRRKRRRHRNPESRRERSLAARRGARHRHRHYRNPESRRERSIAARLGAMHRKRLRHRNPAAVMGDMGNVLIPALVGAGGALGLNILLGLVKFLPESLKTGYGRAGVQIAGALAIGALGPKVGLSRRTAVSIAAGISVIALYDVASTLIASKFPNVNLGETFLSLPGNVMTGATVRKFQPTGGFGEVFPPTSMIPIATSPSELPTHTFG